MLNNQEEKLNLLTDQIRDALESGKLDTAASVAEDTLKIAESRRENWEYGNAIHLGHLALGEFALSSGALRLS